MLLQDFFNGKESNVSINPGTTVAEEAAAWITPTPAIPYESDPSEKGLLMTALAPEFKGGVWVPQGRSQLGPADSSATATFQPRQCLGEDQEKKEEELPRLGSCRPLSRVADSGPKSKVNYPIISALPSLKLYPRMCGHILEPDSRSGLRPVNVSSAATDASVHALADDPGDRRE